MTTHRENYLDGRSRSPAGRLRRSRSRARFGLERLETRLLLSGTTEQLIALDFADPPPTGAWIVSDPPRDLLGPRPELLAVSKNVTSSIAFEVRRTEKQSGPEPLAPSSVEIRSEPEDSLAWVGLVSETGDINDSPESAQTLPPVKFNRVIGHVSQDDLIDMFRIAIDPDTSHIWILLKPAAPTDYLSGQIIVLDDEGRVLHRGTLPPDGAELTVNIEPAMATAQSSLYVGILADEPSSEPSDASSPSHYELQISQEESIVPPPPPPAATEDPPVRPIPFTPPPALIGTPAVTEGSILPSPDQDDEGLVQDDLIVGSLPVISAGPLGGILSESDLLQTVELIDAALVDSSGYDQLPPEILGDEETKGTEVDWVDMEESGSVVVLEGSGGFPVLAAASLASRPPLTDAAAGACLPDLLDSIGRASTAAVMASREVDSREGNRPTRRSSIALAVHVAALMATGLLLPDFMTLIGDRGPRRRHRRRLVDGSSGRRIDPLA